MHSVTWKFFEISSPILFITRRECTAPIVKHACNKISLACVIFCRRRTFPRILHVFMSDRQWNPAMPQVPDGHSKVVGREILSCRRCRTVIPGSSAVKSGHAAGAGGWWYKAGRRVIEHNLAKEEYKIGKYILTEY